MSYFILEILLYYSTHVLGFIENATTQCKHGPYMGEWAKIWFLFSSLIHNSILRGQYQLFLKIFILFGFRFGRTLWWLFQKRVARSELDIYVFSWNIRQYCMFLDIMFSYKLTLHLFYIFSKICSKEIFAYHNPFNNFFNDFTRVSFEMVNLVNNVSI